MAADDQFYREYILDHYKNPRNFGRLEAADISHEEENPLCGDVVGIDLKVEGGSIADVRFHGGSLPPGEWAALVSEVAPTGQHHSCAGVTDRSRHFVVAFRPARLDDRRHAGVERSLRAVREREERI